jgi:hypothetical protein
MPPKSPTSKSKTGAKNDKAAAPRPKLTLAQIAFIIFAILLILSMVLSLVSKF